MGPAPKRPSSPTNSSSRAAPADRSQQDAYQLDERGEFEDAYEDEFEEEDIASDRGSDDDNEDNNDNETGMEENMEEMGLEPVPYLPNLGPVPADDPKRPLVPDLSSYVFLHHANLTWPALSFDILRDNLGSFREKTPHEMSIVAGTQASMDEPGANELIVMRWEGLSKIRKKDAQEGGDSDEEDDDDDEDDEPEEDPRLTHRSIPHEGPVNRVRAQPFGANVEYSMGQPYHVATFAETGKVHIYDVGPHLAWLHDPTSRDASSLAKKPVHTIQAHGRAEGFALAWAPISGASSTSRRLLSGDIHSKIYLTELDEAGGAWTTSSTRPFASHTSSVEDIAWSPNEATVFASCSADCSMRIWDTRVKNRKSVLAVPNAHDSDVNVLSWNASTSYTMVTGGDEGHIKVWDLRQLQQQNKGPKNKGEMARLVWHNAPITSVEWNPNESSSLAASGADDQVSLWELSVEADEEENAKASGPESQVPPQLMFVHQGQRDVKELHWHPQIPGSIVSTALDGFDIFKTISF